MEALILLTAISWAITLACLVKRLIKKSMQEKEKYTTSP